MLEIEKVAVVSHEMREVQRRGGTFNIHLRGFFSSITPHVAAAVIPPSATSSKTSSGVPIGVILYLFLSCFSCTWIAAFLQQPAARCSLAGEIWQSCGMV